MYKIFAVLHLRIRLFVLLTAWKGNGTGVYAEISFHEFYTSFLFNLLICSFFLFSCFILFLFYTRDIYPRRFVFHKVNVLQLFFYCWFSHDVTKIQTTKLSMLSRFYFHDVLEQLKTNFHTNFLSSKRFLVL